MISPAMTDALAAVSAACDARVAKAVSDALAAQPAAPDPQVAVEAADAEAVAAVHALAAEINPPSA